MAKPSVVEKVTTTAKWAEIMTRWHITFSGRPKAGKGKQTGRSVKWQLVSFLGPNGRESRGVVDLVAIRKDHGTDDGKVRRGDFFDIVLIQIKGGGAGSPTDDDAKRMRAVQKRYRARASVFVHWRKGEDITWHRLAGAAARNQWPTVDSDAIGRIFK
jgi:hypothetical protein